MTIDIQRTDKTDTRTIGCLYINNKFAAYTLEDRTRPYGEKVSQETAIPSGVYRLIITHSKRFDKALPLILDVPGFTGIRIHAGNTAADTSGCVLIGLNRTTNSVVQSAMAMDYLLPKIQSALDHGEEVTVHIG